MASVSSVRLWIRRSHPVAGGDAASIDGADAIHPAIRVIWRDYWWEEVATQHLKMKQYEISFEMINRERGSRLVIRALRRARTAILSVAAVYVLSVATGIVMVHSGSKSALKYRDQLVARAQQQDAAAISYREGHRLRAAVWDFTMNLTLGAVTQTITGLTVVSPYGFALYRGWVGGIVSVDRDHKSRFADWRRAAYYLITLILQLIPYSLAGGIGVHLGLSYFKDFSYYTGDRISGYPKQAIMDVVFVYCAIIPMSLLASLWEFLSPWN